MVNVEHLRSMSVEELMRLHDEEMQNRAAHYNVCLDELARREAVRQVERMEVLTRSLNRLTTWIVALTVLIAIATVVGVILTAVAVISGA